MAGLEVEDVLGGSMGGFPDGDGHGRRRRLQASSHIDSIAGEEALAAGWIDTESDQGFARVHPHAHLDRVTAYARQGVDLVDQA